ncbi:hypothetical protein Tco_1272215 [Tanacetum coccineum]
MNTTQAQQKALDDALVAPDDRLEFGKCNMRLKTNIKPKEATFQVVLDTLALTSFYHAFLIIVYPQAMGTHGHGSSIRFTINKKKVSLNVDIFRYILQFCPKIPRQVFEDLLLEQDILSFIKDLGHTGDITYLTDVNVDYLHQPWRAFATVIHKCLSGKEIGMEKIPLSRLVNIPLEAWNVRAISALASKLGRPIKMDQVTADMCRTGSGRLGYARVLIEINAEDEFFDKIEINYVAEGFVEVYILKNSYRRVWNKEHQGNKQQPIRVKVAYKPKEAADKSKEGTQERTKHQETRAEVNKSPKVWNVGKDNIEELRKSASKYAVLSDEENNIEVYPFLDKRLIVDEFIKKKLQPTCEETRDWNYDMINYFKIKWEAMERQDLECSDDDCWNLTIKLTINSNEYAADRSILEASKAAYISFCSEVAKMLAWQTLPVNRPRSKRTHIQSKT